MQILISISDISILMESTKASSKGLDYADKVMKIQQTWIDYFNNQISPGEVDPNSLV